jgi:outer membrane protein insertion porin family
VGRGGFGEFFRVHFFLNAGNISDSSFNSELEQFYYKTKRIFMKSFISNFLYIAAEDFAQSFQQLLSNFRAAYGVGLAMRLGQVARIELNYCWPLMFSKGDRLARGVQFGLGIDFL